MTDDGGEPTQGRPEFYISMTPWFSRDDETGIAYLQFRSPDQWSEVAQSEHVELADGPGLVLDFRPGGPRCRRDLTPASQDGVDGEPAEPDAGMAIQRCTAELGLTPGVWGESGEVRGDGGGDAADVLVRLGVSAGDFAEGVHGWDRGVMTMAQTDRL